VPTKTNRFSTAFSAGSLLLKEADAIIRYIRDASTFMQGGESVPYNVIPVNSEASQKRLGREIEKRLRNLRDPQFIHFYLDGNNDDKRIILFYAACKTYHLITDFMIETVLDKWYHMDYDLGVEDFKSYLYRQIDKHQELESLSLITIKKLAQNVLRMLAELGLLKDGKLSKNLHNPIVLKLIVSNGDRWFPEVLLLNETERNDITEQ
jgi:hypothetical protein